MEFLLRAAAFLQSGMKAAPLDLMLAPRQPEIPNPLL
jgi:hypothetical protein